MKAYRYILLDWDGTLAQTLEIWQAALKAPLQKRGHQFSDQQIGANFAVFKERMEGLGIAEVDAMIEEAGEISKREVPNVKLYPGVAEALKALSGAGKKIALVTTTKHKYIDPLLEKHQLAGFFDVLVCGDDVTNQKPDPEPIHKAMQLLGATPAETLMVGDSAADIGAAVNAGIDSALFFPAGQERFSDLALLEALHPTYALKDLSELTEVI